MMPLKVSAKEAKLLGLPVPKKPRVRMVVAKGKMFEMACVAHDLPEPVAEYKFADDRDYLADWAWVPQKIILEVEGGIYGTGSPCKVCGRNGPGGHSSIAGIKRDIEKMNLAVSLGWVYVRCLPEDISSGEVFAMLKRVIKCQK